VFFANATFTCTRCANGGGAALLCGGQNWRCSATKMMDLNNKWLVGGWKISFLKTLDKAWTYFCQKPISYPMWDAPNATNLRFGDG